ncbi:protoheme IX farnesyltransferase [Streptoalloteichus tenebrarius]|uniref:Protoheme IX farnesyltransferase n=1 Tax=Streptoalloteichus tenebrarius (strain ATCC 17920 / DSM 40477 / JCM 4838 / CBS 697.72 / NBRC 16177 / NCIMB 11028 / NRRL B-12390 / A12253. 1 / ISP 5477) TaxID=1933 RepID=A0ABT1I130_STRSD|nr:heme o synthase [Streptoalloteichus tenebrarius]MCP2261460.1 protoheme IX farnesyltransferase [Streptoalloteichus tenebrarius]
MTIGDLREVVRAPDAEGSPPRGPARGAARARAYLALTKPRIIRLLLITTVPAMCLAARGLPSLWLVLWTLVGGAAAAGSANTLNCVIDADIDKVMNRTKDRPLATGALTRREALVFGLGLGALSFAVLWWTSNLLAASLAVAAILFYVLVYTLVLKRRTSQNIVWGGAAGCMPVVIGWAAVTGTVDWPAWVMFAVIFVWTPAHFWALAMRYREDYAAANVPMLPVVAPPKVVARRTAAYTWLTVVVSLLLFPVTSWVYVAVAGVVGAWFVVRAHGLRNAVARGEAGEPMAVFHASIAYLAAVFVGIAVDALVGLTPIGWPL